jgi:hypothetical protein
VKHEAEVNDAFTALTALPMSDAGRSRFAAARSAWQQYLSQTSGLTSASGSDAQMSAQSEEVVASAGSLADMALQLESLSACFRVDGSSGGAGGGYGQPVDITLGAAGSRSRWVA